MGLVLGASAQKVIRGGGVRGGYYAPRPRVSVGVGLGYGFGYSPFYSPFGYGYPYGYGPYGYGYNRSSRPSRLDLQVEDIKLDYADRIKSVRADESLTRKERRHEISGLKIERDKAVVQAKKDYYYRRSAPQKPSSNSNNNSNSNDSQGSSQNDSQ